MATKGIYIDYLEVEKEVKYLAFTYNILSVDSFMEDVFEKATLFINLSKKLIKWTQQIGNMRNYTEK
ncbi:hypothetical protein [Streptococcus thoraltensis]|uniref:hypothetical protein n=1 Tax=Streptococcus thoraltensis TaxID=55085 RepID=UPI000362AE4C|nr:hypothetical protein [Streptococcus thoraltensis]MDY4762295.1 hypothetical protein [Streptococcus thoraltensis]